MMRTLPRGGIVVPVDEAGTVIPDGSVLVADEKTEVVGPTEQVASHGADRIVDVSDKLVVPGFVNTHSHSGIIRGLAEDMPVFEWLDEHIDPTLEAVTPPEARAAYELCFAEGIRAGVTCTLDM
jgi:5-methylthioadenosine/S-adenosylhomocysteine deaminase